MSDTEIAVNGSTFLVIMVIRSPVVMLKKALLLPNDMANPAGTRQPNEGL